MPESPRGSDRVQELTGGFDPNRWWQENEDRFPALTPLELERMKLIALGEHVKRMEPQLRRLYEIWEARTAFETGEVRLSSGGGFIG